jgi:pSer/pThr/pTyr-binding forkhead associated (FHA) protein
MVSRRHCALSFRDGQVWVEDLASRNGTRIDGEPVLAPRPVVDGATLELACLTFVVRQDDFPTDRPNGVSSKEKTRDSFQLPAVRYGAQGS